MMLRQLTWPLLALSLAGCSGREGAAATRTDAPHRAAALQPVAATAPAKDSTAALLAKADAGRILGSASANVWLIIVSDFQCPYCKEWHDASWDSIRKEFVETGKIRVAYMNLPLSIHRNAAPAAHVAMCASVQGKFWPVQDALFRKQGEWSGMPDPTEAFEAMARDAGADVEALRACVKSGVMRTLIQADADRSATAGASSTPTFFAGGRPIVGAAPVQAFREALNAALAAKPSP